MKTVISVCIIALLTTATCYAKDDKDSKDGGPKGPYTDKMIASLELDDNKAGALKALIEQHISEFKSVWNSGLYDEVSRREMHERHRQELSAVLAKKQLK